MYHSVTDPALIDETKSSLQPILAPERDFAVLDRLMVQKPNATCIALESVICSLKMRLPNGWGRSLRLKGRDFYRQHVPFEQFIKLTSASEEENQTATC